MSACIRQTAASHPKFAFTPTFIFCSPICPNNCGVVFLWKYILVFEKWLFSFDRSNMQIFTVNITRVVWPHVTNILDLWYFCQHNPLFYHLNLIPCYYWSWQRNINWHKSLQFAKKSNITLLPCLFMILLAVSMITIIMLYHILARFKFQFIIFSNLLYQLRDKCDTEVQRWINLRNTKRWVFSSLHDI